MALTPTPIDLPEPQIATAHQLVTMAKPLPLDPGSNWLHGGVSWVQYPEVPPALGPIGCDVTGFGTISGATIADGVFGIDGTVDGYSFTQKPFNVYRALKNSTLCASGMIGEDDLESANMAMLRRWISYAIAQEFITGDASGGYGLVDCAAVVSGLEGTLGAAAAADEFTKLAGVSTGMVHYSAAAWEIGVEEVWGFGFWGSAGWDPVTGMPMNQMQPDACCGRFTPVVDAGYTIDFMRNKNGVGSGKVAGYVTGDVYLATNMPSAIIDETRVLGKNVIEVISQWQAILVFNPLTVVAFPALSVGAYTTTASPLA